LEPSSLPAIGLGVVLLLVLGLLCWLVFRGRTAGIGLSQAAAIEFEALKLSNMDLSTRLAVADFKANRLAQAEAELIEAVRKAEAQREAKATADETLASRTEALRNAEERLLEVGNSLTSVSDALGMLRDAKAAVDEALASKTASLSATDQVVLDLRNRLEAASAETLTLMSQLEIARTEKATADETLAARTETLRNAEEKIAEVTFRLDACLNDLSALQKRASDLGERNATLAETLDQERKQSEEKLTLLTAAREEMSKQFRTLAEDVMTRHGESFSKLNKEQIDGILKPLREKLGEFEKSVQETHVASVKERATLAEQIRNIAETGATMGKETKELTEALRGRSQTQGAWGEMVLNTILERSGLRLDQEYSVQKNLSSDEGKRLRPDVIVHLPGKQQMVVDAKVSLTAFEAMVNAATEENRAEHLKRHLTSIRSHISTLGSKDYHLATGLTLDYVVMFVPIEGALAAALQADPDLIIFAAERNVAISTPTTLMIALRTVANVWHVERRNLNAEEIANRAGKLYDKFVGFVTDMTSVGDSMSRARATYDTAMNKMTSGRGNLVSQFEQLKAMGGRAAKSLPPALLGAADADTGQPYMLAGEDMDDDTGAPILSDTSGAVSDP